MIHCLDSVKCRPMRHIPRSRIPTERIPTQLIPIERISTKRISTKRISTKRIAEPEGWADQIVACVRGSRCCADRDLSSPAAVTVGRR